MNLHLTLALRYLWGRKLRTFLTTLAIVFGVLVIFGMNILLPTMLESFQKNILSTYGAVDVTITHKTGEAFEPTLLNRLKAMPGVRAVAGELARTINIPPNFYGRGVNVNALTLVGVDPATATTIRDYPIAQGRFLRAGDSNVAVISAGLADTLKLKVGDRLALPTADGVARLTIVGITPARSLPGTEPVYATLTQTQRLLDQSNRINTIEANLATTDAGERTAMIEQIKAQLGKNYHLGALTSGSEFFASLEAAQAAFNGLGFLALFMGGFIIFNTFRTIVAERRHDIGMLRAIGASRGMIVGFILAEGLVQGIIGTGIGMVLGYLMGVGISALANGAFQTFLNMQIGAPVVEPLWVVVSIVLGIGTTLVAGLLPAVSAGRVTPIEVLRPTLSETAEKISRVGAIVGAGLIVLAVLSLFLGNIALVFLGGLFLLVGLVLAAPALIKPIARVFSTALAFAFARQGTGELARGNLTRQPTRAAITASATMIGLAVVVAASAVVSSLNDGLMGLVQKTLGSDYLLIPPSIALWKSDVGANQAFANKIRAINGVDAVSTLRFAQTYIPAASARGAGEIAVSVLGIDPVVYPQVVGLDFSQGDPQQAYAALANERAIVLNGILAAQANFKVGDVLALATPEGQKDYRVVAIGGDMLNAKITTAFISQANLRDDFPKTEDIFFQVNLAPGANAASVDERMKSLVAEYPQFRLISGKAYFAEIREQFDASFAVVYILLGVLAIPSLIAILNTLAIGVIERTREIGMLRAIGATRGQVRRVIVAEALLLAAIGTAFGLLGGLYLGYLMVVGISATGLYKMAYAFPFAGLLAAIAVGLLFGVLAALIPARQATRMEIVQALRYE
ncbi:MAG: ABC transporter permease [Chloroflexi bacterium]|nr:ABC transporter permease [Chloroflexota bacterium]